MRENGVAASHRERERVLTNLQLVTGPLPDRSRLQPLDMTVLETVDQPGMVRRKVAFTCEPNDRTSAYLLIPKELRHPAPAMMCLHQTTPIGKGQPAGLDDVRNLHYALELANRGFVTVAPDYPNFGEYRYDPYDHGYASATMKGIWNHMRVVDLLRSLPEVDAERIGCIGHSLGGHNTIFVAVFDPRIKVMVSSCGFTSFAKYCGGDLVGWSHRGYMPRISDVYAADPARMPFDFADLIRTLAPRPLFINAPLHDTNFDVSGVRDCIEAARPAYERFGAGDRLVAVFPNTEHDFPQEARAAAYSLAGETLQISETG